jgi:hypothetical protein
MENGHRGSPSIRATIEEKRNNPLWKSVRNKGIEILTPNATDAGDTTPQHATQRAAKERASQEDLIDAIQAILPLLVIPQEWDEGFNLESDSQTPPSD